MTPEEEIIYLENHRSYINSRIQKLKNKIKNDKRPKLEKKTRLSYTGLFVQSSCLVPYLKEWINGDNSFSVLAEQAVVSDGVLYNIWNGKSQWTREETAEAILIALGLPHVFNELEKVRIKRSYAQIQEPPQSQYFEE